MRPFAFVVVVLVVVAAACAPPGAVLYSIEGDDVREVTRIGLDSDRLIATFDADEDEVIIGLTRVFDPFCLPSINAPPCFGGEDRGAIYRVTLDGGLTQKLGDFDVPQSGVAAVNGAFHVVDGVDWRRVQDGALAPFQQTDARGLIKDGDRLVGRLEGESRFLDPATGEQGEPWLSAAESLAVRPGGFVGGRAMGGGSEVIMFDAEGVETARGALDYAQELHVGATTDAPWFLATNDNPQPGWVITRFDEDAANIGSARLGDDELDNTGFAAATLAFGDQVVIGMAPYGGNGGLRAEDGQASGETALFFYDAATGVRQRRVDLPSVFTNAASMTIRESATGLLVLVTGQP